MKKLFLLSVLSLISCDKLTKKKYYIEIEKESFDDIIGHDTYKEKKEILADNDIIAYEEAYKDFKVSIEVQEGLGEKSSSYKPISFKLLNSNNEDITYLISPITKDSIEKEVDKFTANISNNLSERIKNTKTKSTNKVIDSDEFKSLKKHFVIKKEEFSNDRYFYLPSNYPKHRSVNYLGFYFGGNKYNSQDLHLLFQYSADDWLFVESIKFDFDGKFYEYGPLNCETNVNNGIQEWSDNTLRLNDEIIQYFKGAKKVKYRLEGKQFYRDYNMSPEKLKKIQNTIKLFELMN